LGAGRDDGRVSVSPSGVAEAALQRPIRSAAIRSRAAVSYDPYLPGRSVERVHGVAELADGGEAQWSAIVKRTEGPGLRAARRELAAYRVCLADPRPRAGLRAPALLGAEEDGGHVEIWLEVVVDRHGGIWTPGRFGIAAGHIAEWDIRVARVAIAPDFDSEDAWAERHGQPHRLHEGHEELEAFRRTNGAEDVMVLLDDAGFARTAELIRSTEKRIARLATFPQTPLHHDLVRSNLFAITDDSTAAIDWENVGRGPWGVDLAPLVIGSVRRGEASADDLDEIERVVLDRYTASLGRAGVDRDADVRAAYRLAIGLRWHVVLGTIRSALDAESWGMRGSRRDEPRQVALRHLAVLARHILDVAESEAA